jgi:hypothetical protein
MVRNLFYDYLYIIGEFLYRDRNVYYIGGIRDDLLDTLAFGHPALLGVLNKV